MYTRGKWYIACNGQVMVKHENQHAMPICQMPFSTNREADEMPEAEANARLIAAAPDMYEALKALFENCAMVHKHWGDGDNQKQADAAIAAGRAAIAKAEGK